jgi:hypothetical protein
MDQITAVGAFEDRDKARAAVEALRRAGFADDDVGLLSREDKAPEGPARAYIDNPRSAGDESAAGVGIGAAAGAAAGLGTGAALAAGLIPGVGPVVAGGLALALLMAGSGAAAGSLLGGLFGLGVPQDEAEYVHSELAAGRTLVLARAGDRYAEALRVLHEHGANQRTIDVGPRS